MPRLELLSGHAQGCDAEVYRARGTASDWNKYDYAARRLRGAVEHPEKYQAIVASQRALLRISHPNVVASFGVALPEGDDSDGDIYVLSELVDCRDLRAVLDALRSRGEKFPVDAAVHVARCLWAALDYVAAATRGAHGAITPDCVLLCADGAVMLADLGVARHTRPAIKTRMGTWYGPLGYAAPEQLGGDDADVLSDVYQVGLVLYELLAGAPLFGDGAEDRAEIIDAMLRHEVPSLPRARVPAALDELVHVVLSKNRQLRPVDLGLELAAIARGGPAADLTACASAVAKLVRATPARSTEREYPLVRMLRVPELRASGPRIEDEQDPTSEAARTDTMIEVRSPSASEVPDDAPTARTTRVPTDLRGDDLTSIAEPDE